MDKLLDFWENKNKDKHGKHYHEQQKHVSPFVPSVSVMLGKEALFILENLSRLTVAKNDEPILHVQGWINGRITIVVAVSYSHMNRRYRLPSPMRDQDPY